MRIRSIGPGSGPGTGGVLVRARVIVCMLLSLGIGCAYSPLGSGPDNELVHVPAAIDMRWQHFGVHLEPTVMLWAREIRLDIRDEMRRTLSTVEGKLHGSAANVSVQAGSYKTIPDIGIGGFTSQISGDVRITMDQRSPVGLDEMLKVWLPLAIAHELHHSKRILDGPGYGTTLIGAMVTEGSAEAFVRELFPSAPVIPWVKALGSREAEVWRRARAELNEPDLIGRHETWFFGNEGLPKWAGYRLGYEIVSAYLKRHPKVRAADLATLPAADVLAGSGFE